ncbi:hypothetical protein HHL22_13040 [Hymenobacter sp. RP-2-7]|uniref:Uncharacterized protein n=1 Tax=Hymenobacter polaris TaxID=2682546 RepID=A0A7Y0AEW6_9BACT|nr:hypothetical protein [Hymenobacter polaris]NML66131.1 hypothetical protein [Hymenobacter polaris]
MRHRYLLPLLLALGGCATATRLQVPVGYCDPPLPSHYNPAFAPRADFDAALTPALLARYPRRNLLTANAVGILPLLQELLALEQTASWPQPRRQQPAAELAVLRQRQRIQAQISLVSSTVSSLAAELDCEGERADQVAGYLQHLDDRRTQRLNVLGISVGAASGIGTTVIDSKPGQYAFGIGGGLLAAGLGLLTLRQQGHTVEFRHPRNLLTDVWAEAPTSATWPPSVWYMLSTPAFSNAGQTSLAHNARQRWQHYGQLAHLDSKQGQELTALLFGEGGTYSADELTLRANLLNELQSAVRLLNQELQALQLVVNS